MFSLFKKKTESPKTSGTHSGPILPRIKTPKFLKASAQLSGMTNDQMPVAIDVAGDLIVTFAMDIGPALVAVTFSEMKSRQLTPHAMYSQAVQNARPLFSSIKIRTNGPLHFLDVGHDMEACSLLMRPLWEKIAGDLGDTPIAIFPDRNAAFYTGRNSPGGLHGLREMLGNYDFNETHALSQLVFSWGAGKWSVFDS